MASKDNFFKARLTVEQAQTLENIVKEIKADTPEANVSASSIARYALEKYVDDYRAKKSGNKIIIEVSTQIATREEMQKLDSYISEAYDKACKIEGNTSKVADMLATITMRVSFAYANRYLIQQRQAVVDAEVAEFEKNHPSEDVSSDEAQEELAKQFKE